MWAPFGAIVTAINLFSIFAVVRGVLLELFLISVSIKGVPFFSIYCVWFPGQQQGGMYDRKWKALVSFPWQFRLNIFLLFLTFRRPCQLSGSNSSLLWSIALWTKLILQFAAGRDFEREGFACLGLHFSRLSNISVLRWCILEPLKGQYFAITVHITLKNSTMCILTENLRSLFDSPLRCKHSELFFPVCCRSVNN